MAPSVHDRIAHVTAHNVEHIYIYARAILDYVGLVPAAAEPDVRACSGVTQLEADVDRILIRLVALLGLQHGTHQPDDIAGV